MHFNNITHIILNPAGTYSYVGCVPSTLLDVHAPTRQDLLAGRILPDGQGWTTKPRRTLEAALTDAQAVGATLCALPTCACRHLF